MHHKNLGARVPELHKAVIAETGRQAENLD